jgi:hypothetical protein
MYRKREEISPYRSYGPGVRAWSRSERSPHIVFRLVPSAKAHSTSHIRANAVWLRGWGKAQALDEWPAGQLPGRQGSGQGLADGEAAVSTRGYSCLRDSIGSSLEARKAGIMPLIRPTVPRITVDATKVAGWMISRMSPASPFFANAL